MSVRLEMQGFSDFKTALRNLPEELAAEGAGIVLAHSEEARQTIQSNYPEGPTGNLKRGVTVLQQQSPFGAIGIVRSRAKHAWLFEFGSKPRQTSRGANRGFMPAAPQGQQMIPAVIRIRRRMVNQLIELMKRAGLTVSGA